MSEDSWKIGLDKNMNKKIIIYYVRQNSSILCILWTNAVHATLGNCIITTNIYIFKKIHIYLLRCAISKTIFKTHRIRASCVLARSIEWIKVDALLSTNVNTATTELLLKIVLSMHTTRWNCYSYASVESMPMCCGKNEYKIKNIFFSFCI